MTIESTLVHVGFLTAAEDCSAKQFRFAKGSGNDSATFAKGPTDSTIGVIQDKPKLNEPMDIAILGVTKLEAGGVIAAWDKLTSDSVGRAVTATADSQFVGAIATKSASGVGIIFSALLLQGGGVGASSIGLSVETVPLVVATTIVDRAFQIIKPGAPFTVTSLAGFAEIVAGSVVADAVIASDNAVIKQTAITINGTPAQFDTSLARYMIGGAYVEKAATTANTFTAAHIVTGSLFGSILVQINAAGTISTKVVSTTQAYATQALAIAALPAPDAGKIAIGRIDIAAGGGGFTANTTALTGIATFVPVVQNTRATTVGITYASGTRVVGTLSAAIVGLASDNLILLYTTDGSGALTNGEFQYGL